MNRFVQKQMGIWRSSSDDDSLDGFYTAKTDPPGTDLGYLQFKNLFFIKKKKFNLIGYLVYLNFQAVNQYQTFQNFYLIIREV